MSAMAAKAHTYYLARWDRCFGDDSGNAELCALLKREWLRRSHDEEEPTMVDGLSAWLDRSGTVHICLVRMATAQMLNDEELARQLLPYLAPFITQGADREAPEHPPG